MLLKNRRNCPLCGNARSTILYQQKYSNHFAHNIAICNKCGFVFVSNLPNQKYYDKYYGMFSKYEENRDSKFHEETFLTIKTFLNTLNKKTRILDIGCGNGHLLY